MDGTPNYTTCYIAFLDLLGFKKIIESKQCEEIVQIFSEIKKQKIKKIFINEKGQSKTFIDQDLIQEVKLKIMSDCICFFIDASIPHAFFLLLAICDMFQFVMAKRDEPILMRGGIVQGQIYAEGDIAFGPGLTDAYLLEEKSAKYPRIIISKETLEEAKSQIDNGFLGYIDGVTQLDEDGYYIIDYLSSFFRNPEKPNAAVDFYKHIIAVLDRETDPSIIGKYLYLKKRIETFFTEFYYKGFYEN